MVELRRGARWRSRPPLVTDHSLDLEFGRSAADRRAYRALFGPPLDAAFLDGLRAATNGEWAFGDEGFKR